jgi:prepilin-type processing-associated H-X9-DG protein
MVAYLLYADGNHGKTFIYRENLDDYWIDALRPYHSDVDALRRCPVADDPPVSASGWGTSTQYWTRKAKATAEVPEPPVREGGYGFNGWLYRLAGANHPDGPEVDGGLKYSRGTWTVEQAIERYVRPNAKEATRIPVFGDCIYPNGWPRQMDDPPANVMTGRKMFRAAPNEHMMVRFTIARHGRGINVGFLDGHAERVPLERMKMLKWHEDFQYDETDWPQQLPKQ